MKKKIKKEIKTCGYDAFTCIADKCTFTCCQEWKITVDDTAYEKWNHICETGQNKNNPDQYVTQSDGTRVMALNEQKQCPFLTEQKLCSLVLRFGEDVLSETCAAFPRLIHEFADRTEYSLDSCCPEVVDMMERQDKICFAEHGSETDEEDDILLQIRTLMISIMQNQQYSVSKSILMIFYILLDLEQKGTVSQRELEPYQDAAALQNIAGAISGMQFRNADTFEENNELFLDVAENYRKQGLYTKYLEPIAAAAERLSEGYEKHKINMQLQEFEKQFSSYEKLFRNFLAAEMFSNSLIPESDLEGIIVMFQWIAMEYAMMRHSVFLSWLAGGQKQIPYQTVRDYVVVISRMMGYDQEDIYEYLETSFKSLIWEWGYLALLTGA